MGTLTYGLYQPEDGDKGQTLFDKLEANIAQMDAHNHNGSNSPKLSSLSLEATRQVISSGGWVSVGNGLYRQAVSSVGGLEYEKYNLAFHDDDTADRLYLDYEYISPTQFYVYINDNTKNIEIMYS